MKSRKDMFLLVLLTSLYFLSKLMNTSILPFYTLEGKRRGANLVKCSFVMAAYPSTVFMLAPIIGHHLSKFDQVQALLVGNLIESVGHIAFGFAGFMPDDTTFILYSLFVRSFTASGAAITQVTSLSIAIMAFPDNVSMVTSAFEVAAASGVMVGPMVGALLYQFGGFQLPFISIGMLVLFTIFIANFALRKKRGMLKKKEDVKPLFAPKVLVIPGVLLTVITLISANVYIALYEIMIPSHLLDITNNKISKSAIGIFLVIPTVAYIISAATCGYLADKKKLDSSLLNIGLILMACSLFMVGPFPPLQAYVKQSIPQVAICVAFDGLTTGMVFTPMMSIMQSAAREAGIEVDLSLNCLLSSIFSSGLAIGEIFGFLFGGLLMHFSSFAWATTTMCVVISIEAIIYSSYRYYKYINQRYEQLKDISEPNDFVIDS